MELFYRVWKNEGEAEGRKAYFSCQALPITWVHETLGLLELAARMKASFPLSLGDAWHSSNGPSMWCCANSQRPKVWIGIWIAARAFALQIKIISFFNKWGKAETVEGFIRKPHLKDTPEILDIIVQDLNDFLGPLVIAMVGNGTPPGKWSGVGG